MASGTPTAVAKTFNLKAFVIGTLRRASYRSPNRNQALKDARIARGEYRCASCHDIFGRKLVRADHIEPIVPVTGWDSWDAFMERLFLGKLQILCVGCHGVKTKAENKERRANAKAAKA